MKSALWCILLALCVRAQPRVFCPSAAHYFNFNATTPTDSVAWSHATVRLVNNAKFATELNALALQPPGAPVLLLVAVRSVLTFANAGGYAQFNWLEAGSTALTIVTWVYIDAVQDAATIISLGVGDSTSAPDTPKHAVYVRTHATSVEVGHGVDGAEESATAELALAPQSWTHLAAVFAVNGTIQLFVNGTQRATNIGSSPVPYALRTSCYIGRSQHAETAGFTGAVADFGMYYEPLSGETIRNLVAGSLNTCDDFQLETTFARLDIGQHFTASTDQANRFEGEILNFAVYHYDLLSVLFASTLAEASEVERTSTFLFITIGTTVVTGCLVLMVLTLSIMTRPGRDVKRAMRKRPVSYSSRTLTL
jgi:hypothetical protein